MGRNSRRQPFIISTRSAIWIAVGLLIFSATLIGLLLLLREPPSTGVDSQPASAGEAEQPAGPADLPTVDETSPNQPEPGTISDSGSTTELTVALQPNQTLSGLAALYSVPLESILAANDMTGNEVVLLGQRITIPLTAEHKVIRHRVQIGQTLTVISALYNLPLELLQSANNLTDPNAVFIGQNLLIVGRPGDDLPEQATVLGPEEVISEMLEGSGPQAADWPRSLIGSDVADNYPQTLETDLYRLHYQPGTFAENNLDQLTGDIDAALATLNVAVSPQNEPIDVFVAGTRFAGPYTHLRDTIDTQAGAVFLLYDGSGSPADRVYFITHALTRLRTWQGWGPPASTLLLNGYATYVANNAAGDDLIPSSDLCAASAQQGSLPDLFGLQYDWQRFDSPESDRLAQAASGCFVEYLFSACGAENFPVLFASGDYVTACGAPFDTLQASWSANMADRSTGRIENPALLLGAGESVTNAYDHLFTIYDTTEAMRLAYAAVDQARSSFWRGEVEGVTRWLVAFADLTGYQP